MSNNRNAILTILNSKWNFLVPVGGKGSEIAYRIEGSLQEPEPWGL